MMLIISGFHQVEPGKEPATDLPLYTVGSNPYFSACYAPDTPEDYIAQVAERVVSQNVSTYLGEQMSFQPGNRWGTTATDGSGLGQGDPTVITWNIVNDGLFLPGLIGEPGANSDLRAFLDSIYPGGEAVWLPIFETIFTAWGDLIGVTYVHETNDDGAPFSTSPGVLGVRADVRVGGHLIDGNSGILAYNSFPNNGDMVIDTADNFYFNTGGNSLGLRNVLSHEHGHGMGIFHVCPVQQTKLMEPFVSFAFDGPQHDDILTSNRLYGDSLEPNDSAADATQLGDVTIPAPPSVPLSVDGIGDQDLYRIESPNGGNLTVTLTPVGFQYLEGPQNQITGACTPGTSFNSLTLNDLSLSVLDTDGTTVLGFADDNPAGQGEMLNEVAIGAGSYYIRVSADQDAVQLYEFNYSFTSVQACVYEELIPLWAITDAPCLGRPPTILDILAEL